MSKVMLSFVAGAIFGVLFAPRKGSKTRKKLVGMATSIKDNFQSAVDNVTAAVDNSADGQYENIEGRAQQLMS